MSPSMNTNLLTLPAEIRREILIQYLLLSAPEFEAPKGIHAVPFDRALLVFCDSKAEIGSIPFTFGEIPETKPQPIGEWSNFYLSKATLNLMLVNKLLYNEVSSCILSEFALIPPRQIFRFVHWIPFLPNINARTFDLVRHLQLRVSFSLNEKGTESSFFYDAINKEDVARFQEFRDWFGRLRSVRFQIGFRGGNEGLKDRVKDNIMRRIMACLDVFKEIEVLLFVEPCKRREGYSLAYGEEGLREEIIGEIIGECQKKIKKGRL